MSARRSPYVGRARQILAFRDAELKRAAEFGEKREHSQLAAWLAQHYKNEANKARHQEVVIEKAQDLETFAGMVEDAYTLKDAPSYVLGKYTFGA